MRRFLLVVTHNVLLGHAWVALVLRSIVLLEVKSVGLVEDCSNRWSLLLVTRLKVRSSTHRDSLLSLNASCANSWAIVLDLRAIRSLASVLGNTVISLIDVRDRFLTGVSGSCLLKVICCPELLGGNVRVLQGSFGHEVVRPWSHLEVASIVIARHVSSSDEGIFSLCNCYEVVVFLDFGRVEWGKS